jgi:hypothetical protein
VINLALIVPLFALPTQVVQALRASRSEIFGVDGNGFFVGAALSQTSKQPLSAAPPASATG